MINAVKTGGHISLYQLKLFFTIRLFNSALVLTKIKVCPAAFVRKSVLAICPEAFLISAVLFVLIIIIIILLTVIPREFFQVSEPLLFSQRSRDRTLGLQSVLESLRFAQRAETR